MKKFIFIFFWIVIAILIYKNIDITLKPDMDDVIKDNQILDYNYLNDLKENLIKSNVIVENTLMNYQDNELQVAATSKASGVVYKKTDNIYQAITNYHVVTSNNYDSNYIIVKTMYGHEVIATIIKSDEALDLAIIEFELPGTNDLLPVVFRYNNLVENDFLLAVGNPSNLNHLVTFGNYINLSNLNTYDQQVIHHNVFISNGSSGGGLYDTTGKLVGINTWCAIDNNNYAISINTINNFLNNSIGT